MNNTENLGLSRPNFNLVGWHDDVNINFAKIDQAMVTLGYPAVDSNWSNNIGYLVGARVADSTDLTLWECLVAHTSAVSGTFEADRTLHPSYWVQLRSGVFFRGGWATATAYRLQDWVTQDGQVYNCLIAHTSGVFATDLANGLWQLVVERGGSGLGTGDVVGPPSAVTLRVAIFSGSSGKLIADGGVLLTDLATLASPPFTGNPTAPTQAPGDNSTKLSTTAFVTAAVTAAVNTILGGVSASFDTLAELAAGLAGKLTAASNLGDVANAATSFTNIKQAASLTVTGVVELATDVETLTATDAVRAVAPSTLYYAKKPSQRFFPSDNEAPTANYATFGMRNSHPVLNFDTTTQEIAIFTGILPRDYNSAVGLTVDVTWMAATAVAGTIGWDVAFERIDAGTLDTDADSFATAKTITATTVSATSGITTKTSIAFTNSEIDGLVAGENYRIRLRRDVANDTAAGDAQMLSMEVRGT